MEFNILIRTKPKQAKDDNFKGVEGMKRRKQSELLVLIALFYFCAQIWLRCVKYAVLLSFNKLAGVEKVESPPAFELKRTN